jgi:hypothetical protein
VSVPTAAPFKPHWSPDVICSNFRRLRQLVPYRLERAIVSGDITLYWSFVLARWRRDHTHWRRILGGEGRRHRDLLMLRAGNAQAGLRRCRYCFSIKILASQTSARTRCVLA